MAVEWDRYMILPCFLDLSNKTNAVVFGNFIALDRKNVKFLIFDSYPYEIYPSAFMPSPMYESRRESGNFDFLPTQSQYYFVFDNHAYSSLRYFKLNAALTWTEMVVKYREVPVTQVVYRELPVQVPRQREIINREKKSLFQLLTG